MPKSLAEIVLEEGLGTAAAVERAAEAADRAGTPLVVALVRELGLDEVALIAALRRHIRIATADPATVAPEPEALRELPRDVCRRQRVVPLALSSYDGRRRVLRLAMADPTDAVAVAEVEHLSGCRVEPVLMTVSAIEELAEKTYRAFVTEVMARAEPAGIGKGAGIHRGAGLSGAGGAGARGPGARGPGARGAGGRGPGAPGHPAGSPPGNPEGPTTVPFHRLSDEADVELRLEAVVHLLLEKRLISEDELEETVLKLMRRRDEEA